MYKDEKEEEKHRRIPRASTSFLIRVVHFFVGTTLCHFKRARKEVSFTRLANGKGISLSASTQNFSLSLFLSIFFLFEYDYFHSSVEMDWSHRACEHTDAEFHARARTKGEIWDATRKLLSFVSNASSFTPLPLSSSCPCHNNLVKFRKRSLTFRESSNAELLLFFFFFNVVQTKLSQFEIRFCFTTFFKDHFLVKVSYDMFQISCSIEMSKLEMSEHSRVYNGDSDELSFPNLEEAIRHCCITKTRRWEINTKLF